MFCTCTIIVVVQFVLYTLYIHAQVVYCPALGPVPGHIVQALGKCSYLVLYHGVSHGPIRLLDGWFIMHIYILLKIKVLTCHRIIFYFRGRQTPRKCNFLYRCFSFSDFMLLRYVTCFGVLLVGRGHMVWPRPTNSY